MTGAERQRYSDLLLEVQLMRRPVTRDTSMMIELLSIIIAAYEAQQLPIADATPEAVLAHLIENSGRE